MIAAARCALVGVVVAFSNVPDADASLISGQSDSIAKICKPRRVEYVLVYSATPNMKYELSLPESSQFCHSTSSIKSGAMKSPLSREQGSNASLPNEVVWIQPEIKIIRNIGCFDLGKRYNCEFVGWCLPIIYDVWLKFESEPPVLSEIVSGIYGDIGAHLTSPKVPLAFDDSFIDGDRFTNSRRNTFHGGCGTRGLGDRILHVDALCSGCFLEAFRCASERDGEPSNYAGRKKSEQGIVLVEGDRLTREDEASAATESDEAGDFAIKSLVLGVMLYGAYAVVKRLSRANKKHDQ